VVLEDFFWLRESLDFQGVSMTVTSSLSLGRMWSSRSFDDFPPATNNVRPPQGGAAAAVCRRHADEGHLKNFIVIFVFLRCFVLCYVSFNARVPFVKNYHASFDGFIWDVFDSFGTCLVAWMSTRIRPHTA
jgi:hypothetical protein